MTLFHRVLTSCLFPLDALSERPSGRSRTRHLIDQALAPNESVAAVS